MRHEARKMLLPETLVAHTDRGMRVKVAAGLSWDEARAQMMRTMDKMTEMHRQLWHLALAWSIERRIYAIDAPSQWALARTRPPEWWDKQGCVERALELRPNPIVWIQFHAPLRAARLGPPIVGCFVNDLVADSTGDIVVCARTGLSVLAVAGDLGTHLSMVEFTFHEGEVAQSLVDFDSDVVDALDEENQAAYIVLNFLAAMRYTKRLEATEHKLPKASPKEERHERRTGRTRAPWTTIRLAVGGSEPAIQREIQARAPAAPTGATHASPVGHWVTGHWHRYWVLQPDANDKPDAERSEDGRVLHRVARWLQPYFVDGPAPAPSASRVAKVVLA